VLTLVLHKSAFNNKLVLWPFLKVNRCKLAPNIRHSEIFCGTQY